MADYEAWLRSIDSDLYRSTDDEWTCATDGRRLLAVKWKGDFPYKPKRILPGMFQPPFGPDVSMATLRDFCQVPSDVMEPCEYCDGGAKKVSCGCAHDGCRDHLIECEDCTKGFIKATHKGYARFDSVVFNRALIADFLKLPPDESVRIGLRGKQEYFFVFGENWRFILMPVMVDSKDYPVMTIGASREAKS